MFDALTRIFFSPVGLAVLSVLDSSLVFFLPLAIDASVIVVSARYSDYFWVFPIIATIGSVIGATVTYWIGKKIGDKGLASLVSEKRLDRVKERVDNKGIIALAIPAMIPPPFPLTPFLLVCGALEVGLKGYIFTLASARLLRFGVESLLALFYGESILSWMNSDIFRWVIIGLAVVAIAGSTYSGYRLWRSTKGRKSSK